jgi:hypothetical protein
MDHVRQFIIHAYLAVLNDLKRLIYRVSNETFCHLLAFLSFQLLEGHLSHFKNVKSLPVFITREGNSAERARRVLNYSKLRFRSVFRNPKQRLGFA